MSEKRKLAIVVSDLGGSDQIVGSNTYDGGFEEEGLDKIEALLSYAFTEEIPIYITEYLGFPTCERIKKYTPNSRIISKISWDAFKKTSLHQKLDEDDINEIVVLGFNLDACVFETVKTAKKMGYNVLTSPELMFGGTSPYKEVALDFYLKETDHFEKAQDLLDEIKGSLTKS